MGLPERIGRCRSCCNPAGSLRGLLGWDLCLPQRCGGLLRMRVVAGCARASCRFPAFRERVGRVTSCRLIRKRRRRQQRLPNRGAVGGGGPRLRKERGVTRKRKPIALSAPVSGPCWAAGPGWAAA